ncbi:MAG TPA: hypothetical protein VNW98_08710 [Burkholderiaceae bacterium]|nr:hypothetical protein [Burkholderiaceae bacterium]
MLDLKHIIQHQLAQAIVGIGPEKAGQKVRQAGRLSEREKQKRRVARNRFGRMLRTPGGQQNPEKIGILAQGLELAAFRRREPVMLDQAKAWIRAKPRSAEIDH